MTNAHSKESVAVNYNFIKASFYGLKIQSPWDSIDEIELHANDLMETAFEECGITSFTVGDDTVTIGDTSVIFQGMLSRLYELRRSLTKEPLHTLP